MQMIYIESMNSGKNNWKLEFENHSKVFGALNPPHSLIRELGIRREIPFQFWRIIWLPLLVDGHRIVGQAYSRHLTEMVHILRNSRLFFRSLSTNIWKFWYGISKSTFGWPLFLLSICWSHHSIWNLLNHSEDEIQPKKPGKYVFVLTSLAPWEQSPENTFCQVSKSWVRFINHDVFELIAVDEIYTCLHRPWRKDFCFCLLHLPQCDCNFFPTIVKGSNTIPTTMYATWNSKLCKCEYNRLWAKLQNE